MLPNLSMCQPNLTGMPSGKAVTRPRRNVSEALGRSHYQVSVLNERSNIHKRIPIVIPKSIVRLDHDYSVQTSNGA